MTSSLVGSEMCIRDRNGAGGPGVKDTMVGETIIGTGVNSFVPSLSTLAPVSYTHLTLPTICSV
eukprot:8587358-Prorocentrum_lima.AAC.1